MNNYTQGDLFPDDFKRVRVKKLVPTAIIPSYAKYGDAGLDLTAVSKEFDKDGNVVYDTGLAFEIPDGYVGLLFPRSSISKADIILTNSVGVIDSGYRGTIMFKFKPIPYFSDIRKSMDDHIEYGVGDRIGQILIIPYPKIKLEEVEELSSTERGSGGYGSTGN